MFNKLTQGIAGEICRYTVVGGGAFLLDFSLLYLLTEWVGFYYLISATFAFLGGIFFNYFLSTQWVFKYRRYSSKKVEFFIFLVVGLGGVILTDLGLFVITPLMNGNYLAAKIPTVGGVYFWNFFMRRQLLFVEKMEMK